MDPTCVIAGCDRPVRGRGWCSSHYGRWRRYGDPLGGSVVYVHRLTDVDPVGRTATCAGCGPVRIRKKGTGWECGVAHRQRKGSPTSNSGVNRRSRHHNLTRDERAAMVAAVERCELCGEGHEHLRVDHDHRTGAIRGVLCPRCNSGLGFFRDSPDVLRRAADYVERATL